MNISSRNFIGTQALYSVVLARPSLLDSDRGMDEACEKAFILADKFIKASNKKGRNKYAKRPKKV